MTQQTITWIKNNESAKKKRHVHYLIATNWRKAVAYWEKDEDGQFHWMTTEGHSYSDTVVQEFAAI